MSRRFVAAAVVAALLAAGPGLAVDARLAGASPPARPEGVPAGFSESTVASLSGSTTIEVLPDSRIVVLRQSGSVRLIVDGDLLATSALTLKVCSNSERGLLGFTSDPDFLVNHVVYVYYTRPAFGAPGGCVNRVSRFTMIGNTIDQSSEFVLVDNISSVAGNHNGGDLEIGKDGYLYIAVGDAGSDPRGDSGSAGSNNAAQDLSLLNGKILRVDRVTGDAAPDNPLVGQGAVACRVRGNTPSTPTTPCAELYAWGLRNPYRFAFDPNTGPQRFFINDVGQGTREEVDEGGAGRNYGWPMREGQCPRGQNPPCAGPPPDLTDPITDYGRALGSYITAGAFVPNGVWPVAYDGGYLFGDGGSGNIWLRTASGAVDYSQPFATGAFGLTDMTFVREGSGYSLYYTTTSAVRRIAIPFVAPAPSGPLRFVPVPPGNRVLDTRLPAAGNAPLLAGSTRGVDMGVDGSVTRAVLVSLAYVQPTVPGFLTAWAARAPMPPTANVNARAGEVVSNMAIVPVDVNGDILLYSIANAHVVIDLLGTFAEAPGPVRGGRFAPVSPSRLADTREPAGTANPYTRAATSPLPTVKVPVLDRGGMPANGVASVVLVVTAISGSNPGGGYVTATPGGAPWPGSANLNTNGSGDIRPNTVVVPVGPDGTVDLHLFAVEHVVVDVAGWFTDDSATPATSGRFVSLPPTREADTRIPLGFGRMATASTATLDPVSVPVGASGLAHNIAIVDNAAPGFLTPFPEAPLPLVAAGNVTAPGQIRSILTFTKLSGSGTMSYYAIMDTDLVVDVTGYFQG